MNIFLFKVGFIMMLQLLEKRDAAYIKAAHQSRSKHNRYGIDHRVYGDRKRLTPYLNVSPKRDANRHYKYGKDHCYETGVEHNPCESLNCLNGGTCTTNSEGIARCVCASGYFGQNCIMNPCESLTCLNGGTCTTNLEGIASCICVEGFFGQSCMINSQENECLNKPGGRCISTQLPCGPNLTHSGYCSGSKQCCVDCNKDIECLAKPKGRCGSACYQSNKEIQDGTCCGEQQVCCKFSPCASNPCINGGSCNVVGETDFFCSCFMSYSGRFCENKISPVGR